MISIIVPIYNCEKYIARCIDSILSQSYTDWELILINDGSLDTTENICKKYMNIDKRIKLCSKKNEGVSIARNVGIEKASGKFICFVDADDYLAANYLERLYDIQQKYNADTVFSSMVCVDQSGHKFNSYNNHPNEYQERQITLSDFQLNNWYSTPCVCGGMLSAEIIRENNLKFNPRYRSGEDVLFKIQYFSKSKKAIAFTDELYFYFQNSDSIVHTVNINISVEAIQAWSEGFQLLNEYELSQNAVGRIVYNYCKTLQTDGILHNMMNKEQKRVVRSKLRMIYGTIEWRKHEKEKALLVTYIPLIYRLLRKMFPTKF